MQYGFEAKRIYRQRRNDAFSRLTGKPVALRRVAYLDTSQALDTLTYLRLGYRAANLWPINESAAHVATLARVVREQGFPPVNTVGLSFDRALAERVPEVDIIDFDGTGCLDDGFFDSISRTVAARPKICIGLTMLAGREATPSLARTGRHNRHIAAEVTSSFGTRLNGKHMRRVELALAFAASGIPFLLSSGNIAEDNNDHLASEYMAQPCRAHVERFLWDCYQSDSGQPMLWLAAKVRPHRPCRAEDFRRYMSERRGLNVMPHCYLQQPAYRRAAEVLVLTRMMQVRIDRIVKRHRDWRRAHPQDATVSEAR